MMRFITEYKKLRRIGATVAVALFWLLVWELVYRYVGREILVVSPFHAARRLLALSARAPFWQAVGASCLRVVVGFLSALATGAVLAVASFRNRFLYALLRPLFDVIKATPVASFIILALVWISSGNLPVFIAFIMVVPLVWSNLYSGLCHVDTQLLEMAQVFRFSRPQKIRLIYIPALMPYFTAACSTGLGFSWKSAIAAEVISHPKNSIGIGINNAKIYLDTADLFAWTIAVVILSVLLEKLTLLALARLNDLLVGGSRAKREGNMK